MATSTAERLAEKVRDAQGVVSGLVSEADEIWGDDDYVTKCLNEARASLEKARRHLLLRHQINR